MNLGNLKPTRILDFNSDQVRQLAMSIPISDSQIGFLRAAHSAVSRQIQPIYTVHEHQPVSKVIDLKRGSCSQRLACLEAVARHNKIGTRVQAFWISGGFWHKRFPLSRHFIPHRILLAWPQFWVEGNWCGVEEVFGNLESLAEHASVFVNDAETLFEAVRSTAVDFDGRTKGCSTNCDLSKYVVENAGVFDTRDELFMEIGTLEHTWRGKAFELFYGGRPAL